MSLVYSLPIISNFVTLTGSDAQVRADFLAGVDTALTDATWTDTAVYPTSTFTFNGTLPNNTDTMQVGGKTYTFQTVLTNSDGNVLIGATAADCQTNLLAAITLGAGSGTLYAAATTANTAATAAAVTSTSFTATGIGLTQYTNLGALCRTNGSQSSAYGAWSSQTLTQAGVNYLSPENADDFGQFQIQIRIDSFATASNIFINIATRDGANVATNVATFGGNGSNSPGLVAGNSYRMIASPSSVDIFLPGTFTSDGTTFKWNAPAIPEFQRGCKISGATNASPVVYTTTTNHGYTNGQVVFTRYIGGNSDANTTGVITVISPTTFSIAGSAGSGAYTSGGIVWNSSLNQVGEVAVSTGAASTGSIQTWRNTIEQGVRAAWIINGVALSNGTTGRPVIVYQAIGGGTAQSANRWFNGNYFGPEPWVACGNTISAQVAVVGIMRNSMYVQVSAPGDTLPPSFDGHDWIVYTNSFGGSSNYPPGGLLVAIS